MPSRWNVRRSLLLALSCAASLAAHAGATSTPQDQLKAYAEAAGAPAQAARGEQFFNSRHGAEWSCSSCHTLKPAADGKHASTGKRIAPMAPAANPERFTDVAKTEKWFGRNCKDVLARPCTPAEKADVMAYLMSVKP
jgi:cytochrome c peroxidase